MSRFFQVTSRNPSIQRQQMVPRPKLLARFQAPASPEDEAVKAFPYLGESKTVKEYYFADERGGELAPQLPISWDLETAIGRQNRIAYEAYKRAGYTSGMLLVEIDAVSEAEDKLQKQMEAVPVQARILELHTAGNYDLLAYLLRRLQGKAEGLTPQQVAARLNEIAAERPADITKAMEDNDREVKNVLGLAIERGLLKNPETVGGYYQLTANDKIIGIDEARAIHTLQGDADLYEILRKGAGVKASAPAPALAPAPATTTTVQAETVVGPSTYTASIERAIAAGRLTEAKTKPGHYMLAHMTSIGAHKPEDWPAQIERNPVLLRDIDGHDAQ